MINNWINAAQEMDQQGSAYVIVTLIAVAGSTPRDNGSKMLVSADAIFDSIGGGHLEHKAIKFARKLITSGRSSQQIEHFQLGIHLDQCCGGNTDVLFECFAANDVNIMVFGAGHVAKALIPVLAALPCKITWVDSRESELIDNEINYSNVKKLRLDAPEKAVPTMPAQSYYIVLTHKHQMDFDITHQIINRADFQYFGLIGSKGKWQRFKNRFKQREVDWNQIERVNCPIGLSNVSGKLPGEVAVSIAAEIVEKYQLQQSTKIDKLDEENIESSALKLVGK